ncbi:MAG: hypothetical protein ACLGG7_13200 [Bacteriovoracia bacterium]
MDEERKLRTERVEDRDYDRDVDIRRTMIMGRDVDYTGQPRVVAASPGIRALHWGPIFAGLVTTLVVTLLLGALFVGVGFTAEAGVFGGLTAAGVGWGALIASLIAVTIGSYLTGYVSDLRTHSEGPMNGFMVGVMTIFTPIILAVMGAYGAATAAIPETTAPADTAGTVGQNLQGAVTPGLQNAWVVAADNAWTVFWGGLLILGLATLGGYLGHKSREKAKEHRVKKELDRREHISSY